MTKPTVSIIMATCNRAHFIEAALRSIQAQTHDNWECFVVDDGSTDTTQTVVEQIAAQDPRFRFYKRPEKARKGPSACRNLGLDLARGDYVLFVDDDDVVHPDNLKTCIAELRQDGIEFCKYAKKPFFGAVEDISFDAQGYSRRMIGINDIEEIVMNTTLGFATCVVMWRRSCFATTRFNEALVYAEDWESSTRILSEGTTGVSIDKALYFNRMHANNKSNPVRVAAQVSATRLVIENLRSKQLLTPALVKHFVAMSIVYRNKSLLLDILRISGARGAHKIRCVIQFYSAPLRTSMKKRLRMILQGAPVATAHDHS